MVTVDTGKAAGNKQGVGAATQREDGALQGRPGQTLVSMLNVCTSLQQQGGKGCVAPDGRKEEGSSSRGGCRLEIRPCCQKKGGSGYMPIIC